MKQQAFTKDGITEINVVTPNELFVIDLKKATTIAELVATIVKHTEGGYL